MRTTYTVVWGILLTIPLFFGCSQQPSPTDSTDSTQPAIDSSRYLLSAEPAGAKSVTAARGEIQHGDDVVVVGRIGGSPDPWVSGRAAFSIVDESLRACSDIPGDLCPQPWDYCCETDKLPDATALVKIVDEHGAMVTAEARTLLGVQELSTVVIQGTAQRDDAGNLTILAQHVHVRAK